MGQAQRGVGIVGAGYISDHHVAALRRIPNVRIVGLHDLDPTRAEAGAQRLGIPALASLPALIEAGAEVIHVLTPPAAHASVALEALERGCHVFVEKPLATAPEDAVRVCEAAQARGLEVGVCHSLLFDPQIKQALDDVRAGALGQVVSVDVLRSSIYPPHAGGASPPHYAAAGYPFRDLGIHALYLIEAFLGEIDDVQASWRSLGGDPNLAFDEWRAIVRCKGGLGGVQLSWNVRPLQSQVIVQGTRGVRRIDLFSMFQATRASTSLPKPAERIVNAVTDCLPPLVDVAKNAVGFALGKVRAYQGLQELVAAFYRALDEGRRPPVTAADALGATRWTERVARAAERDFESRRVRVEGKGEVPFLVTGASGALGSALVDRLRGQGHGVRLFVRRLPETVPEGVEVAVGDLGDAAAVERAVRGARVVFHVGAAMKGAWPEHQRATVDGTTNVLEACRLHRPHKLVHVSSLSVVDWAGAPPLAPVDEATPFEPRAEERGAYTRAKLEAERLVHRYVAEHGLAAVIVRPGQIFGGRIPLLTGAVARQVGPIWITLGDGEAQLPLVYIDDVVDALVMAAESALAGGEVIQIVDEEPVTQNDVLAAVLNGQAGRVVRVPRPLVFAAGHASDVAFRTIGRRSPLSAYRLRSALALRRFSNGQARRLLGWSARVGVREGMRRVTISP